jgi:DNA-binding transcriptional LysR family regulator
LCKKLQKSWKKLSKSCDAAKHNSIFSNFCCIITAMMDWDDLRIFLALTRTRSVRAAANVLGVNNSTVSRRIRTFEKRLGVRLFERLPSGYTLTPAGEDMLGSTLQVEEEIQSLERRVLGQDSRLTGELRVTMPDILATRLLMPSLASFTQIYANIELEVIVSDEQLNLTKREADVAIRMTNNPPEHLVGRRLLRHASTAYASTDYLTQHQVNMDLTDLADLTDSTDSTGLAGLNWIGWEDMIPYPRWVKDSPFPAIPVRHRLNNGMLQLEAIKAGMGIAMLSCFIGDREPELRRLPPGTPQLGREIWILTHADLRNTTRVRTFMDYMATAILAQRDLIEGRCPAHATAGKARPKKSPTR